MNKRTVGRSFSISEPGNIKVREKLPPDNQKGSSRFSMPKGSGPDGLAKHLFVQLPLLGSDKPWLVSISLYKTKIPGAEEPT